MIQLPEYVASARPNPRSRRLGWLTTTAASYAGLMLWFVFWQKIPFGGDGGVPGGVLSQGLPTAIGALVLAALLCHYLFYLVPGLLGVKTGLPLAVVGTSTFGVRGGCVIPGLLTGVLQFGLLGVNAFFAGFLLAAVTGHPSTPGGAETPGNLSVVHVISSVLWIAAATLVGTKGVKQIGSVAAWTSILPILVLLWLLGNTIGGVPDFDVDRMMFAESLRLNAVARETVWYDSPVSGITLYGSKTLGVVSLLCTYMIGFFAAIGVAGVDFGAENRSDRSIRLAGWIGIVLPACFTGIAALLIVAGAQPVLFDQYPDLTTTYCVPDLFEAVLGSRRNANLCMAMLVVASFPAACFSTWIAASAFTTSFPEIRPTISCGIGVLATILFTATGWAGRTELVFGTAGALFGPVCGAVVADYLLAGRKWSGPRAGLNAPGWIAWLLGFAVGAAPLVSEVTGFALPLTIPCPPLSAFIVAFVLYALLAKLGFRSKLLDMPRRIDRF